MKWALVILVLWSHGVNWDFVHWYRSESGCLSEQAEWEAYFSELQAEITGLSMTCVPIGNDAVAPPEPPRKPESSNPL